MTDTSTVVATHTATVPRRRVRRPSLTPLAGLALPVVLALLWEAGAAAGMFSERILPPPSAVASTIGDLWTRGELVGHIQITLWRVWWGFVAGTVVATILGAATGVLPWFRATVDPTLQALRSIPSIAWTPLFILWFGIFETSKIILIAVGVFFPVYLTLAEAIANVDRKLVEVGRVHGFGRFALVHRILIPASMPTYIIGLRSGLGLGWMFVVAAEFLGASKGLGYLLVDGQMTGRPSVIIAAIVLFAVFGKLSDMILAGVGRRVVRWQDGFNQQRV